MPTFSKSQLRLVAIALFVCAVAAYFYFGLGQWLSLETIKAGQLEIQKFQQHNPWQTALVFLLVYIAITGLGLPGATVLTLAAGAIFGLWEGFVIVSFASSIGATCAFLLSRFLFRDWVAKRWHRQYKAVASGFSADGAWYLFSARLVPYFPFFLVNLLMGLTPIKTWTYYWVSQVGMVIGTLVYVNAGTQLSELNKTSDILSPSMIMAMCLLAALPFTLKTLSKLMTTAKASTAPHTPEQKLPPKTFDRNIIVIGAGAGGLVSAYIGTTVKASVTLVEEHLMGGDCLNFGCVPSKALIRSAKLAHHMRDADRFGFSAAEPKVNLPQLVQRIDNIIADIEPHDSVERYQGLGVDVVKGRAHLLDRWTVQITPLDGEVYQLTAKSIIIATGARPAIPSIAGIDDVAVLTSDTLWQHLRERQNLPKRMAILGGGPIGCEMAQAFSRLGVEVRIFETGSQLLAREDADVSQLVQQHFIDEGVAIALHAKVDRAQQQGDEKHIHFTGTLHASSVQPEQNIGAAEQTWVCDEILCATGRTARVEGFGLEAVGVEVDGTITTDDFLRSSVDNIFAVGDVAGPFQLTHAAAHQAWYAAVNALFGVFKKFKADYRVIPQVTFTDPEIARVGLNEKQAKEKGIDYEITRFELDDFDRALCDSAAHGFVKVITPKDKDKILGATIVGEHAGELLAELVLAMKHDIGLNKVLGTIHAYPTWAEANKYAAGEWKKAHSPKLILRILEKFHRWRLS